MGRECLMRSLRVKNKGKIVPQQQLEKAHVEILVRHYEATEDETQHRRDERGSRGRCICGSESYLNATDALGFHVSDATLSVICVFVPDKCKNAAQRYIPLQIFEDCCPGLSNAMSLLKLLFSI